MPGLVATRKGSGANLFLLSLRELKKKQMRRIDDEHNASA